jgi:hypothetical protein
LSVDIPETRFIFIPHLVDAHNLSICLLDLAKLAEKVPEAGFGNDIIGSEDSHAVELGSGVGLGGEVAADDLVFLEAAWFIVLVFVDDIENFDID